MTKGCKIWLWIVLIGQCLSGILGVASMKANVGIGIYTIAVAIIGVAGVSLLLFKHRKIGFYFLVAVSIIALIANIMNGVNIIIAAISAVISPAITFFFIQRNKELIM